VKARKAVGLSLASLVLMECLTYGLGSVATGTAAASTNTATCQTKDLTIHGGRQGAPFRSIAGTVVVDNISNYECVLRLEMRISLIRRDGIHLNVHEPTSTKAIPSILLRARRSTDLILYWENWCRANPGPLTISIALAGGNGAVSGSFNGPPDDNSVPGCIKTTGPSSLQLQSP
jgi:hypothetical protein